jgi:DNA gyrase/topoisomerase IV subunit B
MFLGDVHGRGKQNLVEQILEDILSSHPNCQIVSERKPSNHLRLEFIEAEISPLLLAIKNNELTPIPNFDFGVLVAVALSESISIVAYDPENSWALSGKRGEVKVTKEKGYHDKSTIVLDFSLDPEIFPDTRFQYEILNIGYRKFSLLCRGLKIKSIDSSAEENQCLILTYPEGIGSAIDLATSEYGNQKLLLQYNFIGKIKNDFFQISIRFLNWTSIRFSKTYGNYTEMNYGGSLEQGIYAGFSNAIKKYAQEKNWKIKLSKTSLQNHLLLIAQIQGNDLIYVGATKEKLDMPKVKRNIQKYICTEVLSIFNKNPEDAEKIVMKFLDWENSNV